MLPNALFGRPLDLGTGWCQMGWKWVEDVSGKWVASGLVALGSGSRCMRGAQVMDLHFSEFRGSSRYFMEKVRDTFAELSAKLLFNDQFEPKTLG